MQADTLIRGAQMFDGTGAPARMADVAIRGGVIAQIGDCSDVQAAQVIDAAGQVVAPGFIDIHTHSDLSLMQDGRGQSKVSQGVTTEVTGNCGFSPFPINPQHMQLHLDLLAGIGDDAMALSWTDVEGYRQEAERRGIAVNIAPLVGHGALRIAAMGVDSRPASATQLATMQTLLGTMLDQGAFGMTTGLTYVPSRYAPTEELVSLCETLAKRQRLYASHARDKDLHGSDHRYGPLNEALHLGRTTGARVQYSHAAINTPSEWGTAGLWNARFDAAVREGVDAAFDVYPYDASSSALTQYLPAWVQEGGVAAMCERLSDDAVMARAEADLAQGWSAHRIPWLWDRVVLARTDGVLGAKEGQTIEAAAAAAGMTPARYTLALCREGGNRIMVVLFYRTEEDMRSFLTCAHSVMGSDGSAICFDQGTRQPHPRNFGATARVLGRFVRDLQDLDLATAIAKMSGRVAERLRMPNRGRLAPGLAADVVVFDPQDIRDRATYLAPCQPASGINHVFVNGVAVVTDGRQTDARPGRVLRATP
ncbi:MAG: D-aminoacylase [Burkholderiaceae bacterium]